MGVLDDLALGGAERLERTLGKRAALGALVPLVDSLPAGVPRARALSRAIALAAELDDHRLEPLCDRWALDGAGRHAEVRGLVRALLGAGRVAAARRLANAELQRATDGYDAPAARYAVARCDEARGALKAALTGYDAAASGATGQPSLRRAAEVRGVRVRWRLGHREEAAHRAAALMPLDRANPEDRLAVARVALGAPGRYRRAAALDVLERLAAGGGDVARAAIAAAAAHAEAAGTGLTEIEVDRIDAVLSHLPDAVARRVATEQLRALRSLAREDVGAAAAASHTDGSAESFLPRARATLEGSAPGPRPDGGRAELAWLGLAVLHALDHDRIAEARTFLAEATDRLRGGARAEAAVWTAALAALPRAEDAAHPAIEALLHARGDGPPRGYRAVAEALEAAGLRDEARVALRRAAAHREDGARAALALRLRHEGWKAAREGRRDEAIAALREARRLK